MHTGFRECPLRGCVWKTEEDCNGRRVTLTLASVLVAALVVGLLIGCVGIGGVLLTPALVYVGGLGFHLAAATSMWAFLFAGAAGTSIYSKHGSIDWPTALCTEVGPGDLAVLNSTLDEVTYLPA